jgi:hypothetical protein
VHRQKEACLVLSSGTRPDAVLCVTSVYKQTETGTTVENDVYLYMYYTTRLLLCISPGIKLVWNGEYLISLNNVLGHELNYQFQKCKNLNNVPFLCTKLFQKWDNIQGGTLFKETRYFNLFVLL